MITYFTPPRIPYIVFELLKINIENYLSGNYLADVVKTIYLAVTPSQFNYTMTSRDAIVQTDKDIFVNKVDMAPERCTISGNFGLQPRLSGVTYTDGWSRLKEFENDIIKRSKKTQLPEIDGEKYFYAINYYDFMTQKFGSINIQSFSINGNARENTMLPYYSCSFLIIGDLERAKETDALLLAMQQFYGDEGLLNYALSEIVGFVNAEGLSDIAIAGQYLLQAYSGALQLANGAADYLKEGSWLDGINYQNVTSLFG